MSTRDQIGLTRPVGPLELSRREKTLQAEVDEIERLREALSEAVTRRDDTIRTLYKVSTTRRLIKITGLSRDRLYTIAGRPMSDSEQDG